jgi:signal transduction histidine kinase/CheY-like chemotaxis protein
MADTDLRAALEAAPVGFAVIEGPELVFTHANPPYLKMVSRTAITGKRWVDVFPELVGSVTHAAVAGAFEGRGFRVSELPLALVSEGSPTTGYFSFSLDPMRDAAGAITGLTVIAMDVTELVVRRKEAEELAAQLRERESRYSTLLTATDDGFCIFEMILDEQGRAVDYRFLEVNPAFEQHTGLVAPVGKTALELVPSLDESWFRLYGEVAATGAPARFENNAPAMGRWFDVFAMRVGDPAQRRVALLFKNVSERKQAELEKARLLSEAEAARQSAEAANLMKDQFLATMSHELRTPINAVLGWATLLRAGNLPPEKHERALEIIERNTRNQAKLIEDLLDVSRIAEGKLRLDVVPTELGGIIHAAVEAIRPAADAKGVRLQLTLSSGGTVMGDPQRLQQVAVNLLGNAVKFTPAGGRVQVVLQQEESALELSVSDTGIGIAPDFLPHMFERFRQADGAHARQHGGLGIGLSIVRHVVELHGGTVSAFSDGEGKGATFTVRIPVALGRRTPTPASGNSARPLPQAPELRGLDILAVDDDEDALAILGELLAAAGVTTRLVSSASQALAAIEQKRPDILLSDIGMPGETGLDLIAKVRALPADQGGNIPAVALTAYARPTDRAASLIAGFNNHLAKPIEPIELLAVIASLARALPKPAAGAP